MTTLAKRREKGKEDTSEKERSHNRREKICEKPAMYLTP